MEITNKTEFITQKLTNKIFQNDSMSLGYFLLMIETNNNKIKMKLISHTNTIKNKLHLSNRRYINNQSLIFNFQNRQQEKWLDDYFFSVEETGEIINLIDFQRTNFKCL